MLHNVKDIAQGKWRGILASFGLNEQQVSGKHTSCPCCGGKDRFRFDDKDGRGTFYCSGCGAGDGIELVKRLRGVDFKDAAREIEKAAGFVRVETQKIGKTDDQKLEALKRVWSESHHVKNGDEVFNYLSNRGLTVPNTLKIHHAMPYRDGEKYLGKFTAMIAKVQAPDGRGVSIHRTFIKDGMKAEVPTVKKLMSGLPLSGAAIRLYPYTDVLGVAEGIETAIAASMLHKVPVWSCINANGLASFEVPEGVNKLMIFSDNDSNYTGQQAAYTLAKKCELSGIKCEVLIPSEINTDWADMGVKA